MNIFRLSSLGVLLTSLTAFGTEVGDPAPPLQIKEWIKGTPVELKIGDGKVYVIDFWATWSPACRSSIAHLTELQTQFKTQGLVVVGVADEAVQSVKPMVEEMAEKMNYAVGIDDAHETSGGYLRTYGVGGIPHSFVIDQRGRVVWHGHPFSELRSVLVQVLSKNFDPAKARLSTAPGRQVEQYLRLAAGEKVSTEMRELGKKIAQESASNPELLNHLAWGILSSAKAKDLDLAQQAAKSAYESTQGKEPAITDTYARALAEKEDFAAAINLQKEAVQEALKGPQKEQMEKTLEIYEKKAAAKVK
jgi:thiol-disulfide isomerase/thioredoxin